MTRTHDLAGRHAGQLRPRSGWWSRAGVVLLVVALGAGLGLALTRPGIPTPTPSRLASAPEVEPERLVDPLADPMAPADAVLRAWDAARARAFAAQGAAELRALYAPGSATGAVDVRVLRDYAERGLTVRRARMQLGEVTELTRRRDRLRVAVVERLGPAYAVSGDGRRLALPRDSWRSRRLVLHYDEHWRLVSSRPIANGEVSRSTPRGRSLRRRGGGR